MGQFFEALAAALFLINKILLYRENRRGWILNIPGGIIFIWIAFFHTPVLWSLGTFQIIGLLLAIRGLTHPKKRNTKIEKGIPYFSMIICAIMVAINYTHGVSIPDLLTTVCFLVGSICLGNENLNGKRIGWSLYGIGHLLGIYLADLQKTHWILAGQVLSFLIAVLAVIKYLKKK